MMRLKWTLGLVAASIIALTGSGCDLFLDLTGIPFTAAPVDDTGDVDGGQETDADLDIGPEVPDVSDDTGPDAEPDAEPDIIDPGDGGPDTDPIVEPLYCPYDFGTFNSPCDPVASSGCTSTTHCSLGLSGNGIDVVCVGLASVGSLNEGENCAPAVTQDDCRRGLYCLNWLNPDGRHVCSKFCFLSTGAGCGPDQFCTYHFTTLRDVGFCVDRCDPYDPNACSAGRVCAPDPNYALQRTCHPEFRCLRNGAPTEPVEYKSSCVLQTLQNDGCPSGQTCARIPEGQRCVRPCQSNADCSELGEGYSCGDAYGEFELRYCDRA
jgi:hypothetical protein